MKIGFIGLGAMGAPMTRNLAAAGHEIVTVLNRSPLPDGITAEVVQSPAEVATQADVTITMLPDTPDVERVLLGKNGVFDGISAGNLVIDMSSISPLMTKDMASQFTAKGVEFVDAPVSGGVVGAESGNLTIMAGGSESAFARAQPIFEVLGGNITHIGRESGSGQICKIANQIIVGLTIEAVSEALVFASKAGCDPSKVRDALMGGFASSRILELHGDRMSSRSFTPGFRMELHQKDLGLALDAARSLGASLPSTALTQELMNACIAQGDGADDHSGLVKALERLANHQIG